MSSQPEKLFRSEHELPFDSLACRQNWPEWVQVSVGHLVGLAALELLARNESQPLMFLGSPFLQDVEVITSRVSSYTGKQGEYVTEEGPPKITLTSVPGVASMRATINRHSMSAFVGNVDERCWSGHYPSGSKVQGITTIDMVTQARHDPFMHFVAAVDISDIDPADIHPNIHAPFFVDLHGPSVSSLTPELIVPVWGRRDLPADTLVIDEPSVTRAEAKGVFDRLWHLNGDRTTVQEVTVEIDDRHRTFRVRELGQLSVASRD